MSSVRKPWIRGVATLALLGALTAAVLVSPVGAAGTLTKSKVKSIANKVFDQRSGDLEDKCPSGTTAFGGACMETTSRAAQDWFGSSNTCGNAGRRLPTPSELWAWQAAGNDLNGDGAAPANAGEGTSQLDFDNGAFRWSVRDDNTFWVFSVNDARPFRCVASLTNA
ncbi:MAG: hypothetical protein ACRDHM_03170 [Actinomycetota bacterium]